MSNQASLSSVSIALIVAAAVFSSTISAFTFTSSTTRCSSPITFSRRRWNMGARFMTIVSPFENQGEGSSLSQDPYAPSVSVATASKDEILELTWENVELVLDNMRPYLMQDGGNVAIKEIDGPVVYLELQVCC